jgi:hypothetical protein
MACIHGAFLFLRIATAPKLSWWLFGSCPSPMLDRHCIMIEFLHKVTSVTHSQNIKVSLTMMVLLDPVARGTRVPSSHSLASTKRWCL